MGHLDAKCRKELGYLNVGIEKGNKNRDKRKEANIRVDHNLLSLELDVVEVF
ncbi:MAG: hypothetical protein ACI9YE_003331 [Psychroserpens sp.]|jgi:hypothetical protein